MKKEKPTLRELRLEKKIRGTTISKLIGTGYVNYYCKERGEVTITVEEAKIISKALGVRVEDIKWPEKK